MSFLRDHFPFIKPVFFLWPLAGLVVMTCPCFVLVIFCPREPHGAENATTSSDQLVGQSIFELVQESEAIKKRNILPTSFKCMWYQVWESLKVQKVAVQSFLRKSLCTSSSPLWGTSSASVATAAARTLDTPSSKQTLACNGWYVDYELAGWVDMLILMFDWCWKNKDWMRLFICIWRIWVRCCTSNFDIFS